MPKLEGSLINRLQEGHNFTGRELRVGDDITMYYYSDRKCYYITEVISQTKIKVKEYEICADHSKGAGMGHQDWLYFKTKKECNKYLNKYFPGTYVETPKENEPETWELRGTTHKQWKRVTEWSPENWKAAVDRAKNDLNVPTDEKAERLAQAYAGLNDNKLAKIKAGKTVYMYSSLPGKISFGKRDYYHDWEF